MKFTMMSNGEFRQINIYTNVNGYGSPVLAIRQSVRDDDGLAPTHCIYAEPGQARRLASLLPGFAKLVPPPKSRHVDPSEGGDPIDVRRLGPELIEISQLTPGRFERIQLTPAEIVPFVRLLQLAASIAQ